MIIHINFIILLYFFNLFLCCFMKLEYFHLQFILFLIKSNNIIPYFLWRFRLNFFYSIWMLWVRCLFIFDDIIAKLFIERILSFVLGFCWSQRLRLILLFFLSALRNRRNFRPIGAILLWKRLRLSILFLMILYDIP